MNDGLSIWDKLTRVVLFLLLVVSVLGVILWYRPVIEDNQRKRELKLRLERQIQVELETGRKLDNALRSMQDPKTIERMAREKLNYAKPGENVIHFENSTNTPAGTPW